MSETQKASVRRLSQGFFDKYLVGKGIDIGCGPNPVTADCTQWDIKDGDAQVMNGIEPGSFDWVYSSHCLEHLDSPLVGLSRWWEILRPGGYLIVVVPDEDLYEQGKWPSSNNPDHKSTWTVHKTESWSPVSYSLTGSMAALPGSQIISVQLLDEGYDYSLNQAIAGQFVVPVDLAMKFEKKELTSLMDSDLCGLPGLRFVAFTSVDQTSAPFNAEVSIQGIARKWKV